MSESAFPSSQYLTGISPSGHSTGMTLRDYFAAQAMQGLLSSDVRDSIDVFAEKSYEVADAMLKARSEKRPIESTSPAEIRRQRNRPWSEVISD